MFCKNDKNSNISDKYYNIFQNKKPDLKSRQSEILKAAEKFEKYMQSKIPDKNIELICSSERLDSAITSYFYDVCRYKDFHGMSDNGKVSNLNFPKIYAFTIKWFLREKPFILLENSPIDFIKNDDSNRLLFVSICNHINEHIIYLWIKQSCEANLKKSLVLSKREQSALFYNLKFRDINTGYLEMFLQRKF